MKNLLPLGNENMENLEAESLHISFEKSYPPRWDFYGRVHPHTEKYDFIYIIPKISFSILYFNSVNIKQLQHFYLESQKVSIYHKQISKFGEYATTRKYREEFVIHPLLPAIKNSQKQLYLKMLKNSKYSLSEIEECLTNIKPFLDGDCGKRYENQVLPYIPTIEQFDQAVKDVKAMNKEVLKLTVYCLTRFKLPDVLVDKILDFMQLDEIIFDEMEVSVLQALVLKERSHEQNIKHGVLLDMEQSIKNVEDNSGQYNQELIKGNQVQESGNVEEYYC